MAKKKRRSATPETSPAARKGSRGGRGTWKVLDRSSTIAAGLLAREASTLAWRATTGRRPPTAGRHPEVDTREAVAWAVMGGAVVELVKLGVRRWTATYWVRSTGGLPPGMKPIKASLGGATGLAGEDEKEPTPSRESAPVKPARRRRSRR